MESSADLPNDCRRHLRGTYKASKSVTVTVITIKAMLNKLAIPTRRTIALLTLIILVDKFSSTRLRREATFFRFFLLSDGIVNASAKPFP
jgi:hypothetical protein